MIKGFKNISNLVTLEGCLNKGGRRVKDKDLSIIENGSVIFDSNEILWVGKTGEIPGEYNNSSSLFHDLTGHTLTPEIVDSHTHLVFGGNRSGEYTQRLRGADYEEIANSGGGILSTVNSTLQASETELFETAVKRIERIASYGVGTIEIKSGYALTLDKELLITKVISDLKKYFNSRVNIFNTYMAAHAIPKEFSSGRAYLDAIVLPGLSEAKKQYSIDAADIFHERGYFSSEDTEYFFKKCIELGVPIKSHADEFNDNKGAILATRYNALSCDHLLKTSKDGIEALSKSDTVATILPGTGFFLGKEQSNARALWDGGARVALASDYNPGSCHCDNLLLIASIAAPSLKLSLSEVWCSLTLNASYALGLKNQGALVVGRLPRFSLFETPQLDEITYNWGRNLATSLKPYY